MSCWQSKRKGFFLIFALWVIALLSLFCLGLGFRTYIETRRTKLYFAHKRSYYSALSGIRAACALLEDDDTAPDYLNDAWAKPFRQDLIFSQPKAKGAFSVNISDESSRVNINKAPRGILDKIFAAHKVNNSASLLDNLFTYAGRVSSLPHNALEDKIKAQELTSYAELLLIEGFTPEIYRDLSDTITVFGDKRININTASGELLESIIDDGDVRQAVFEVRFGPGKGYFETYAEVPDELEPFCKIASDVFRIVSLGQVQGVRCEIVCVFNRKTKNFLYWHEK